MLNLDQAIHYHEGKFPPQGIALDRIMNILLRATISMNHAFNLIPMHQLPLCPNLVTLD